MAKQSEMEKLEQAAKEGSKAKKDNKSLKQKYEASKARVEKFKKAQGNAFIFGHLGVTAANVAVELVNWPIRKICDYLGWDAADILQSIPHALIGEALWISMLVARGEAPPSRLNEFFATAGISQAAIGWNNIIKMIRGRMREGKDRVKELEAEIARLGGQSR